MAIPYTDGDWTTAQQNGPVVISIDDATRSYIYAYEMVQLAANWQRLSIDTLAPNGLGVLVSESEPKNIEGGCVAWTRTYATLPPTRSEYAAYVHNAQYIVLIDSAASILELPRATVARVQYDYFNTINPSSIAIHRAYRLNTIGSSIYETYAPDPGYGIERVAEDSTLTRWRWPGCNIWERVTHYVVQPAITAYA